MRTPIRYQKGIDKIIIYMSEQEIQEMYELYCNTPSDTNIHLPILREHADRCETVAEFGVRGCISLYALLSSNAKSVFAVDILDVAVPQVEKLTFICSDDLLIELEPTDMLHIDSLHTYNHLKKELALHSKKIKKYISFHDTEFFGRTSEDGTTPGLMDAIEEFLFENKEWTVCYSTTENNGLTIIERK